MLKKSSGTLTQPYHLRLKRHITHDRKHRLENPHVSTHFSPVLPLRFTRFRLQNDSCGNVRKQTTRLTRQSRESWRPADTRDHTIRRLYRKDGKLSGEREGFPRISRSRLSARSPPPPPFSAKKWAQSNITAACQTISGSGPFFLLHLGNSLLLCVPCSASLRWF